MQYLNSGSYDLKLVVEDIKGCKDSILYNDLFVIGGQSATLSVSQTGNNNLFEYEFNASNISNVNYISWDLGNGVIINDDFDGFTYSYSTPGVYEIVVTVSDITSCQISYYLGQVFPGTNSISENQNSLLNISPNPFSNSTTIEFKNSIENVDLTLYNLYGQKVKTISNFSGNKLKLERENLCTGIYYLNLQSETGKSETFKLVIE